MKKISTILSLLLSFVVAFGQSSFPVEVTNPFEQIPKWAYYMGQKNNAYTVQHVNRTQIQTGNPTPIGYLYALNGGFSPQPGKATVVEGFYISSTRPVKMQIRVGTPTGVLALAQIPEMDLAFKVDSTTSPYIKCNWVIRNIKSVFIYCLDLLNPTDTATDIFITPICYNIPDDFNWDAKKRLLIISTSIGNGTGASTTGTMYQTLFKDTLRKLGVSLRYEIAAISGATTATHEPFFKQGAYDRLSDGRAPDLVMIELAVNDAYAGTSSALYTARLRYDAERFLSMPENKKIIVLICGATPVGSTTAYNNSVTLDAAASAMVTSLQATYPGRVFFIPCADAFPRTDRAYYIPSDAVGGEVHPNDAGNQLIMNNKLGPWIGTASGQTVLTALKK